MILCFTWRFKLNIHLANNIGKAQTNFPVGIQSKTSKSTRKHIFLTLFLKPRM